MPGPQPTSLKAERQASRALRLLHDADAALAVASLEAVTFAATRLQQAITTLAPAAAAAHLSPAALAGRARVISRRLQRLKTRLQPALAFWYQQHLQSCGGAAYGPSTPSADQPRNSWNG
jgi:hypothetical protein